MVCALLQQTQRRNNYQIDKANKYFIKCLLCLVADYANPTMMQFAANAFALDTGYIWLFNGRLMIESVDGHWTRSSPYQLDDLDKLATRICQQKIVRKQQVTFESMKNSLRFIINQKCDYLCKFTVLFDFVC